MRVYIVNTIDKTNPTNSSTTVLTHRNKTQQDISKLRSEFAPFAKKMRNTKNIHSKFCEWLVSDKGFRTAESPVVTATLS